MPAQILWHLVKTQLISSKQPMPAIRRLPLRNSSQNTMFAYVSTMGPLSLIQNLEPSLWAWMEPVLKLCM